VQVGLQADPVHTVEPCAFVHAMPHPPQLFTSLCVLTWQPCAALPAQTAKPGLHVGLHAPATQAAPPFGFVQAAAHAPQFWALVCVFVSQPLLGLESQSPKPIAQRGAQAPPTHEVVPFGLAHAAPQLPQFIASVARLVSHPVETLPSQSPKPALHTIEHAPLVQVGVSLFALQAAPHAPQSATLVPRFTLQPSLGLPLQFAKPVVHMPSVHVMFVHEAWALTKLHAMAHMPQLAVVVSGASQPLNGFPSQLPKPALHASWHTPATQVAVAFALPQTMPHAPQLPTSPSTEVSHPFAGLLSQSP
jgi:hypothetical protein